MDDDLNSEKTFAPQNGNGRRENGRQFPETGDFLGEMQNYRLTKLLGEGGMGQAWLAEEIVRGKVLRSVVCKILPADVQSDAQEIKKVESLFQLTRTLNHTNICPLYGMEFDPEFGWFFVMGYAEGLPLREWIYMQPNWTRGLPLEKVLKILKPLASALDYAHKKRVIHRDIKPENIMFSSKDEDSDLWIIDFGIAAQIHETRSRTAAANESSGTPHYMAPEQFLGELQDARTDQYALGVLAYELLSGRRPFVGNIHALAHQILNVSPKPIQNLSPEANAVLLRVLEKRQVGRFPSCTDFVKALGNAFIAPTPTPKPAPRPWNVARRWITSQTDISTENEWNDREQTQRPTVPQPKTRKKQRNEEYLDEPAFESWSSKETRVKQEYGFLGVLYVIGMRVLVLAGLCSWYCVTFSLMMTFAAISCAIFPGNYSSLIACLVSISAALHICLFFLYRAEGFSRKGHLWLKSEHLVSLCTSLLGYGLLRWAGEADKITSNEVCAALMCSQLLGLAMVLVMHRRNVQKLRRLMEGQNRSSR